MRAQTISTACIVGGGPAGLAAAIALEQAGIRATVIDRAVPPIDKTCGEGLLPDSLSVLDQLGIHLPPGTGFPFRGIRFTDAHSSTAADFPTGSALGIRRTVLHGLLVKRAAELGIQCHWGAKRVQVEDRIVVVDGKTLRPDLIVGADGQNSGVRRVAGLNRITRERIRYGFRRHYRMAPWTSYMELHWGPGCQVYITPVASDEVCVVSMSRRADLRLDQALDCFPVLRDRLRGQTLCSRERGALSVSRRLRRISRPGFVLVGDASGSVDAITGEGLCLAFRQALSLATAVCTGDPARYRKEHRALGIRPALMSELLLALDWKGSFRKRALAGLAAHPNLFASLLGVHVGARSIPDIFSWQILQFCKAFLIS